MAVPALLSRQRKKSMWVRKPAPGRHPLVECLALSTLLRDVMGLVEDTSQARKLLNEGRILIDGKAARDPKMGVGLMDLVEIPLLKAHYRIMVLAGKLIPIPISEAESKFKLCKVIGKTIISQNKVQLNFHDGRSQLIDSEEDRFTPGDTVKLSIPKQKIEGFVKLEKGARCYVYRGKHAGKVAMLEEVLERKGSRESDARLKTAEGGELITVKGYLFAVDKDFQLKK